MVHTFVNSALEDLSNLLNSDDHPLNDSLESQIQAFQVDLRVLKMFLSWLITLDPDTVIDSNLISSMLSSIEGIWEKSGEGLYAVGLQASREGKFKGWNMLASKLGDKIQQCKQEIKKCCVHLVSWSLQSKPFTSDEVLEFIDEILNDLKHLHLPLESQIETLSEKLLLFRSLVDFAAGRCQNVKDLGGFMIHVHTWANKVACLTCLYWAGGVEDEEIGSRMINLWLTDLLRKVNPCTPEFIRMCFAVMKSTNPSRSDTFVFGEFVSNFVDFLLENLPLSLKDDIEIIREGLIFMISFFADPPEEDYGLTSIRKHADSILGDASRLICLFIQTEEDLASVKAIVPGLLRKIRILWRHIQELHVRIPNFSQPKTNGLGFVEHLLGKIEDLMETMNCNSKIAPFAKHQISRVKEELMPLSESIHVIWELQNEHEELKDLLDKMIQVAYQAELAVDSSFTIDHHPIWYHLSCLSYVLGEIKDVQNEFLKFKTNQIHKIDAELVVPKQPSVYMPLVSGFDEIVVGFDDDEQVLIDRITRGTAQLDIVPIVGMGGLGKTTLAKKLFNESSIRSHFNVRAFCYVGQDNNSPNRLLLEILKQVIVIDDGIRAMAKDDLAHRLYQCLKGRRYLIIMDDIWDVGAWKGVKDSFPKDNDGSRVVFTTRTSNVALQAISNCIPHHLRFFSTDESWELLQAKAFRKHPCPPHLQKVGKLIAEKCNGLPLAVVVTAGLLARIPANLSSWKGIADDLTSSYASTLGCMDTQELSYKHLPEALKSCLLYFGAFVKEKTISAKRLMLLWAAEGFVPTKSSSSKERSSFLSLAKQYLNDLADRSLVIVHEKSSTGGIKRCGVHDLIRDFCLSKAQEEHFFHFIRKGGSKKFSMYQTYKQYRLCIHEKWKCIDDPKATSGDHSTTHTLLYYPPISDSTVSPYYEFYSPNRNLKFLHELDLQDSTVSSYELSSTYRNFKFLHVLDLQEVSYVTTNYNDDDNSFPEEVTVLVNLRYIALKTKRLSSVPPIIANLWNLETFVLQRNHLVKLILPETIWKMKRLRHVDVGSNVDVELDDEIGKDSSKLANVESFSSVTIAHGEVGEELLRRLSSVRKLSCCFRSCWDEHRKVDQLPKLEEYLIVLESLNIVSDGVSHPCVFSFPTTLKKLTLSGFNLPWIEFSTIAQLLPCLEVLKLMSNAFVGSRWDVENEEFPGLKYLELSELDISHWIASADTFPCLVQLIVFLCHNLVEIPPCFAEVPTLKAVNVLLCNKGAEESAIQIQNEQLDMGNTIQVQQVQQVSSHACNIM